MRPLPPFRLDFTAWALRRLPNNEMDRWDGTTYRRALTLGSEAIDVAVTQSGGPEEPELRVVAVGCGPKDEPDALLPRAEPVLRRILGVEVDLGPFYRLAATFEPLDRLATRFRGLKPPRFPTVFEGVVNGIACQQLSLNVGIALLNRLCSVFGRACGAEHAFPAPPQLASADPAALHSLGFSTRKAENIVGLAAAVVGGRVDLEALAGLGDPAAVEALDRLDGVGRWTAQYAALRGLGRVDVFPADDVGSQNKIKQWLALDERPGYDEINRRIAGFRPYRGLIYFHLLLNSLAGRGALIPASGER
jgi:DNA-3-methyladenine glycosylase II